ncbi:MAG TPA: S8 family serine peptidase, partial [Symbiobacteriaceae bacterium]|nr:S8 family serine peptidase [Symbiobacteriaceae bacterium]
DDIIGLGTASPTGYIRMDGGTSFATPLVAGAAALALSDLAQQGAPQNANRWQQVFDRLAASAIPPAGAEGTLNTTGLGAGIIQVTAPNN